jgi:hypothetical protein
MTQHWRGVGTRGIQGMVHVDSTPRQLLQEIQEKSQETQTKVDSLQDKQAHFRARMEERFGALQEQINRVSHKPFVMPEIPITDLNPLQHALHDLTIKIDDCALFTGIHGESISSLNSRTAEFQERMEALDHIIAAIQVPYPIKQNHYPAITAIILALAGIALHFVS